MSNEIDYPSLIDTAMRNVVKAALAQAQQSGLPGNHHFYISFRTVYPGLQISDTLLARYPEEMTIVLQHQYWDLKVMEGAFTVTLSFNNIPEKLVIPYDAITAFADPSVKFGLQFHVEPIVKDTPAAANSDTESTTTTTTGESTSGSAAKVITLDSFRKK